MARIPCEMITVVDARSWKPKEWLTAASLQGIVNRVGPRLAIIYNDGELAVFRYFIEKVLGCGFHLEHLSLEDLVLKFRDYVNGVIIYDPKLPDTVNLATVLASIDNFVVAHPSIAERLTRTGLPVVKDLRGVFQDKIDVYNALMNLLNELNTSSLIIVRPDYVQIRDYAIKHRLPTVSLNPLNNTESALLDRILDTINGRLVLGFFPEGSDAEVTGVILLSRHGKTLIVADLAGSLSFAEWFTHLTPPHPANPSQGIELEPGGAYASIIVSDGDNIGFLVNELATSRYWLHPERGRVPVGWTVNPWIARLAPHIAWFLYGTATRADCFLSGVAGAGYIEPMEASLSDLQALAAEAKPLVERLGLSAAFFWPPPGYRGVEVFSKLYNSIFVAVSDQLQGFPGLTMVNGVPVLYSIVVNAGNYREVLSRMVESINLRPAFLAVVVDAWSFNYSLILELAGYLKSLGFKLVCPQVMAKLAAEYLTREGYPPWTAEPRPGLVLKPVVSSESSSIPDRVLVYSNATGALLASIRAGVQLVGPGGSAWTGCDGGSCSVEELGDALVFTFKSEGYSVTKNLTAVDGIVRVSVSVEAPGYKFVLDPALDELDVRVWPPEGPRQPLGVLGPLYVYVPGLGVITKNTWTDNFVICRDCNIAIVYSTGYPYPRAIALYVHPNTGKGATIADMYGKDYGDVLPEIHSLTIKIPLDDGHAEYEYWIIPLTHGWAYKPPQLTPWELGPKAAELTELTFKIIKERIDGHTGSIGTPTSTPTTITEAPTKTASTSTTRHNEDSLAGTPSAVRPPTGSPIKQSIIILVVVLAMVAAAVLVAMNVAKNA